MKQRTKMLRIAAIAGLCMGLSHAALSAEPERYDSASAVPTPLLSQLTNGGGFYEEQYVAQVLRILREGGRTHVSIDAQDIETQQQQQLKNARRRAYAEVAAFDTNFDGVVTQAEIRSSFMEDDARRRRDAADGARYADEFTQRLLKSYDTNGDGNITFQEIASMPLPVERNYGGTQSLKDFLDLDPNKDGVLTAEELQTLAHKAFRTFDRNGDGTLDLAERQDLAGERRQPDFRIGDECRAPLPAAGAKLAFVGGLGGVDASTVSVAGPSEATGVAVLTIADGAAPVYLALAAGRPTIWQLQGNLKRISQVTVFGAETRDSQKTGAGVTGIAADKVKFLPVQRCLGQNFWSARDSSAQERLQRASAQLFGRNPDFVSVAADIVAMTVSDTAATPTAAKPAAENAVPKGFDEKTWQDMQLIGGTKSGSIVTLNKASVVSDHPAEDYALLPGWAGLAKLVHDGYLERVSDGTHAVIVTRSDGTSITLKNVGGGDRIVMGGGLSTRAFDGGSTFRMLKEFPVLPTGLSGVYSIALIVPKDIKIPSGDFRQSCIKYEDPSDPRVPQDGTYSSVRRCSP